MKTYFSPSIKSKTLRALSVLSVKSWTTQGPGSWFPQKAVEAVLREVSHCDENGWDSCICYHAQSRVGITVNKFFSTLKHVDEDGYRCCRILSSLNLLGSSLWTIYNSSAERDFLIVGGSKEEQDLANYGWDQGLGQWLPEVPHFAGEGGTIVTLSLWALASSEDLLVTMRVPSKRFSHWWQRQQSHNSRTNSSTLGGRIQRGGGEGGYGQVHGRGGTVHRGRLQWGEGWGEAMVNSLAGADQHNMSGVEGHLPHQVTKVELSDTTWLGTYEPLVLEHNPIPDRAQHTPSWTAHTDPGFRQQRSPQARRRFQSRAKFRKIEEFQQVHFSMLDTSVIKIQCINITI